MKKIPLLITIFAMGLFTHAQKGKEYMSLDEALRNPLEVFILSLNTINKNLFSYDKKDEEIEEKDPRRSIFLLGEKVVREQGQE